MALLVGSPQRSEPGSVPSGVPSLRMSHFKFSGLHEGNGFTQIPRGMLPVDHLSPCTADLLGKDKDMATLSLPPSSGGRAIHLGGCHTSSVPILSILPRSSGENVAMPTLWLLLVMIYECVVQPSDRQSFLVQGHIPNHLEADRLRRSQGTQ